MRITYDTDVDALTLVVTREPVERTVDVGDGRFIDLDEDGKIVAIEFLDVSRGLHLHDLVEKFDMGPVVDALADHLRTAKSLLDDSELRDTLVR